VSLEDKSFLVSALCHHEKCGEFGLFIGTSLSSWELVVSFLDLYFILSYEITFEHV
jgi:hypothetical protein